MRGDLDPLDPLLDEGGGDLGLVLANIGFPEEKLTVEVGYVDRVHVYDMDVLEAGQGDVLEDLAAQASSTDHEDLGAVNIGEVFLADVGILVEGAASFA